MAKKRFKPEEIVAKLRQVDVLQGQGSSVADAVRQIGVTEVTYYRWRREYGGMKTNQLRRLKELEKENQRLRRAVSDLTLDKLILAEAARGTVGQRSETSEPLASPIGGGPRAAGPWRERAPRLPHAPPASFDPTPRSRGADRRSGAHGRDRCQGPRVWPASMAGTATVG